MDLSLLQTIQTGSRDHPVSYSMGNGSSLPRGKETGACGRPLKSFRGEVKNEFSYTSNPHIFLSGVYSNNLNFTSSLFFWGGEGGVAVPY